MNTLINNPNIMVSQQDAQKYKQEELAKYDSRFRVNSIPLRNVATLIKNYNEAKITVIAGKVREAKNKPLDPSKATLPNQPPKEVFVQSTNQRSTIVKNINKRHQEISLARHEKINTADTVKEDNYLLKPIYFTSLNMVGSIRDISTFISEHFKKGNDNLYFDCLQIGFAGMLHYMSRTEGYTIDHQILNPKNEDEKKNMIKILKLYQENKNPLDFAEVFFRTILDGCADAVLPILTAFYNRDRAKYVNRLESSYDGALRIDFKEFIVERIGQIFDHDKFEQIFRNLFVDENRDAWLNQRVEAKPEEHMELTDITKLALELKIVDEIVAKVPPAFREERQATNTTFYPKLGLSSRDAHNLIYNYGVSFTLIQPDMTPVISSKGGKSSKPKTIEQARGNFIKQVIGYFAPDNTSGEINASKLMSHQKYLNMSDTFNPTQGTGLQLVAKNSNVVLMFPNNVYPEFFYRDGRTRYVTKEELDDDFKNRHDETVRNIRDFIIASLGYNTNSLKDRDPNNSTIQTKLNELYALFSPGETVPHLNWNNVPVSAKQHTSFISNSPALMPHSTVFGSNFQGGAIPPGFHNHQGQYFAAAQQQGYMTSQHGHVDQEPQQEEQVDYEW